MWRINKIWEFYQHYGLKLLLMKLIGYRKNKLHDFVRTIEEDRAINAQVNLERRNYVFSTMPKISIVVPVYDTPERFLHEMIESVMLQTYNNWELCIADGSISSRTKKIIDVYTEKDTRIKYIKLEKNEGIVGNSNRGLEICSGNYVGLLDHDDILTEDALFEVAKVIEQDEMVDIVYSDEDKISMDSELFFEPHCKPDYNLDLLRANNYICHFLVIKKSIIDQIGGFRKEFEGAQDYDLILRSVECAKKVVHIPQILYHWRSHNKSTAENPQSKLFAYEAGKNAIQDHLKRINLKGEVVYTNYYGFYHVKYEMVKCSKVAVIIHGMNSTGDFLRCKRSIYKSAGYDKCFFSYIDDWMSVRIDNIDAEYLLFVSTGVEMISSNWMQELLALCQREDVGVVGIKLYEKREELIVHAGIVDGRYVFRGFPREHCGYFHRDILQQDVSAVTKDFLMISKQDFMVCKDAANSEMELCAKVNEMGKLIVADLQIEAYV